MKGSLNEDWGWRWESCMTTDADAESRFGTFAGNHGRRGVLVACTLLLIAAAVTLSAVTRLTPYVRESVRQRP